MNTILTDDELLAIYRRYPAIDDSGWKYERDIEAALLAKLREQEPIYQIKDESDTAWLDVPKEAYHYQFVPPSDRRIVYAAPLPAVVQVPKCKCGQPWVLNTVHRENSPCWRAADPADGLAAAPEAPATDGPTWQQVAYAWGRVGATAAGLDWGAFTHAMHYAPEAPAQPSVPAPWREAVKVAREAMSDLVPMVEAMLMIHGTPEPGSVGHKARAALAQLDALEGRE